MHYLISDTTSYALTVLQSKTDGIVHSVYRKTINLLFGGQLLALQSSGSPLSPLSLIASQTDIPMVSAGQKVTLDASACDITVHAPAAPIVFSYREAKQHDLFLYRALTPHQQTALRQTIRAVLSQSDRSGFSLLVQNDPSVDDSLILSAAKRQIQQTQQEFLAGRYDNASAALCQLIGLGIGLTPSGDDFLCGVLAGLRLLGRDLESFGQSLRLQASRHLARTNEISAAFLRCALSGQFSRAVCSLSDLPSLSDVAHSFAAIGHSSGMDTLCGIDFVFQLYPI